MSEQFKADVVYQHGETSIATFDITAASDEEAEGKALAAFHERMRTAQITAEIIKVNIAPGAASGLPVTQPEGREPVISMPDIRDGVGDDEPVVEFAFAACRACSERSDPVRVNDDTNHGEPLYDWVQLHRQGTGHSKFHRWSLTRNDMRTFVM